MEIGKLPPELLERMLGTPGAMPEGLVLGPGLGRDAAVVQLDDRYLVLAADPISFPTPRPGWYAVHVNANDVACLGADPRWFLATVLLPPSTPEAEVESLFDDLRTACAEVGAFLVGGHTEVTDAVHQPVLAGAMVGETPHDRLFLSGAGRPGDLILQLGPVAIEGTAILATEAAPALRAAGLDDAELRAAAALLDDPGISVLPVARALWPLPGLRSLHDPTEGGIATAAWELADASGLGLRLEHAAIRRHPLTDRIARALEIDWLGLLASGSLLAVFDPAEAANAVRDLHNSGHEAAIVGELSGSGRQAILSEDGATRVLPRFQRDELTRVLAP